jgi:hypothetical protein
MMTETMTIEKKTTKKSIPNLLSAHPRAEKAPYPIPHALGVRLRYHRHGKHVVTELKRA